MSAAVPLVSCLCVTRARVPLLRRAVSCFQHQTYARRELLIVCEGDDAASRDYLGTLDDRQVRVIEVPAAPRLRLGTLRNLSVEASRGRYLAQWDDDDWHGPHRLQEQLAAIHRSRKPACALRRWTLYDALQRRAFLSAQRAWEGSLLAERGVLPAYADVARGEDTAVVQQLRAQGQLMLLDRPELYVYVYHGHNTWARTHWEQKLLPHATPLRPEQSAKIGSLLESS